MYNETNVPGPEFRVRPVVRYVVTRYCHPYRDSRLTTDGPIDGMVHGGSAVVGEFLGENQAFEVAQALARQEEFACATVSA